ncbi:MAG: hypothetical protein C5B48_08645 [Candidatus Rokuibacteriota bacterium]|nr:MAG: hypothetical protein C5B48_08645 [Candidatus Rokubacteria bacterium]
MYGEATPYLPVIDLLTVFNASSSVELLNIAFDDAAWLSLEPMLRRQRTLQALRFRGALWTSTSVLDASRGMHEIGDGVARRGPLRSPSRRTLPPQLRAGRVRGH